MPSNLNAGITWQLCYTSVLGDNSIVMHRYVQAFIQDCTAGGGGGSDRLKVMLA